MTTENVVELVGTVFGGVKGPEDLHFGSGSEVTVLGS